MDSCNNAVKVQNQTQDCGTLNSAQWSPLNVGSLGGDDPGVGAFAVFVMFGLFERERERCSYTVKCKHIFLF